ncbi:hypothetical protein ACJIZ3_014793 [Penstemon smallii]|uniref:Pentatricopeptide repeat-containing protein n=1 Tax=Penstemon smallii TaxID=265156 RepID=A0ABD3RUJ6_9LAMI
MRNQLLRLLLLRCHTQSQPHISQVHHLRSFTSSLLPPRAPHVTYKPLVTLRHFTSSPETSVEPPKNPSSDQAVLLAHIFSKPEKSIDEIKLDLDSNNVVITHDLILSVLRKPETSPYVAKRVFDWVLEDQSVKLSSKSYNYMLGILGSNGFVEESCDMIEIMRKKGYGVHKGTFVRISEKFEKDGLSDDVEKLKELYATGSVSNKKDDVVYMGNDSAVEKVCSRIRGQVWGDELEKQLRDLKCEFSSDRVTEVLENLKTEPNKALIFFRWVEESDLFKHDQQSYNAMAIVLGREECSEKFWRFINEMRSKGHEMKVETYVKLLHLCVERKMISAAVDLYEFAMIGENKPSAHDCIFLLKKIVVSKELDMDLFFKVVRIFRASGNELTDAHLNGVFKSLTSVGRITEYNKILKAMEEEGYLPSGPSQCKIAYKLSSGGKTSEALEFKENMVASRGDSDYNPWVSLIIGFCEARDLDEASNSFKEMVESLGNSCAGYALNVLVGTYCRKNRPLDAYKLVLELIKDKDLTPRRITYKTLTSKLLAEKCFKEALDLMKIMTHQGYSPDSYSFVEYFSKTGSAEDAVAFITQAKTSKKNPPKSVFIRLFQAYLNAGRLSVAQDVLSQCPKYIRDHADVLNIFCTVKSEGAAVAV